MCYDGAKGFANPVLELATQGNLEEIKRALSDPNYIEDNMTAAQRFSYSKNEFTEEEKNKFKPDLNTPDEEGYTPLMKAVLAGHIHVVEFLLEQGADLDAREFDEQQNALMLAAAFSQEDILATLLEAGADIESKDIYGWTALTHAAYNGHAYTVYLLINEGAEFDSPTNDSWTPIMITSRIGHGDVIEVLLQFGASIDGKNAEGWTPVMIATISNHIAVVQLLLDYGADIYQVNKNGDTVITLAEKAKYANLLKLLQKHAEVTPIF